MDASNDDFDPTPYIRPPIMDVPSGVALGTALLSAVPTLTPAHVRKAAKRLSAALATLEEAWEQSESKPTSADKRPADIRVDKAWGALHRRIDAYAQLPQDEYPLAKRAAGLMATLFPNGLGFLAISFNAEWAEGEMRLKMIAAQKLEADIEAVAGAEFLAELKKAHALYGEILGVTRPAESENIVNLVDPLRALGRAVTHYALVIIATLDESEDALADVRRALQPIDEHRERQSAHRSPKDEPAPANPTENPAPSPSSDPA